MLRVLVIISAANNGVPNYLLLIPFACHSTDKKKSHEAFGWSLLQLPSLKALISSIHSFIKRINCNQSMRNGEITILSTIDSMLFYG